MTNTETNQHAQCHDIAAWILSACALVLILKIHLLPALLAGLLVYELTNILVRGIHLSRLTGYRARVVAVTFIAVVVVTIVSLCIIWLTMFFRSGNESLPVLLTKMAEILEDSKKILPVWIVENYYPPDAESLKIIMVEWLKENAVGIKSIGTTAGRIATYILIGMVIGAIISLRGANPIKDRKPLASALAERVQRLGMAFRNIVFAQIRIAGLNACFTWLYLCVALPLFDVHLPFTKTLVAVTFVVGLMPVIGNIISNTFIVIVSLSHSLPIAISSLAFLVVIHKLEYFLNAKIVGSRINARAWELLVAMLVMEAIFGIPGVIAAPIYYAYLKEELSAKGLI
ncbi:MAG: AI-2E family transporter [Kiritimatiellae bacterium]|nr:AI-2E family transporter [Kiritimatiellia bacterium]MDD5520139.1 AI-2E family transporter [Kiritimatiellia bacterium]